MEQFSAASPPSTEAAVKESYLSGTSGAYVDEMYKAWSYNPKSVQLSMPPRMLTSVALVPSLTSSQYHA